MRVVDSSTPLRPASIDLSVIILTYNEKPLPPMLSSTMKHLLSPHSYQNARTFKILIVDGGSSDGIAAPALSSSRQRHTKTDILL